jgi:hypothetical protein
MVCAVLLCSVLLLSPLNGCEVDVECDGSPIRQSL